MKSSQYVWSCLADDHQLDKRTEANIFVAFKAYCLHAH